MVLVHRFTHVHMNPLLRASVVRHRFSFPRSAPCSAENENGPFSLCIACAPTRFDANGFGQWSATEMRFLHYNNCEFSAMTTTTIMAESDGAHERDVQRGRERESARIGGDARERDSYGSVSRAGFCCCISFLLFLLLIEMHKYLLNGDRPLSEQSSGW